MFLDDEFLLTTETARTLFHKYAEKLPIVDYHCHLSPAEIAEDENFPGIVQVWLGGHQKDGSYYGDHYKWRLMRAQGVPENLITGDAPDWDRFSAFAATMEQAVGNPVYLWTHLELQRIFGIKEELNRTTAKKIFEQTNELLTTPEFSPRNLIRRFNVEIACTTDDPADDLRFHKELTSEKSFRTLPAYRPDKALNLDQPTFGPWIESLEGQLGHDVSSYASLVDGMAERVDYFHALGARMSDHAVDTVSYEKATPDELDAIFVKARHGGALTKEEVTRYRTALLEDLLRIYHDKGWTAEWHIHAARNLSTRGFSKFGVDTGFDGMYDQPVVEPLVKLLDDVEQDGKLPGLILFSLNPNDWLALASVFGSFQGGQVQKIQLGNAWWFNDTRSGIRNQITVQAEQSLLGNFIGMTTDSRSFLSYPRHEFFRRILCELLGEWAERGEVTNDLDALGALVRRISYENAKSHFDGDAGSSASSSGNYLASATSIESHPQQFAK